jgi:hypothetical protein
MEFSNVRAQPTDVLVGGVLVCVLTVPSHVCLDFLSVGCWFGRCESSALHYPHWGVDTGAWMLRTRALRASFCLCHTPSRYPPCVQSAATQPQQRPHGSRSIVTCVTCVLRGLCLTLGAFCGPVPRFLDNWWLLFSILCTIRCTILRSSSRRSCHIARPATQRPPAHSGQPFSRALWSRLRIHQVN